MKLTQLNLLKLAFVTSLFYTFYSCNKSLDEISETSVVSYRFHHDMGYDDIRNKIQNSESIDLEFKGHNILINDLKVADGISIQNSILLNSENDYILIDDNTDRIYIRKSDYDKAIQTEVYFFKNNEDKDLLIREYNLNRLNETEGFSKFIEAENSYLIQKRIPKSKEELMNSFDHSLTAGCGMEQAKPSNVTASTSTLENYSQTNVSMVVSWNLYIYKRSSSVDVASSVSNLYTSWKSLNSSNSSNYYYSTSPYAGINIIYDDFSYTNYISTGGWFQLQDFKLALQNNNASTSRSIHLFITGNERWEARGRAYDIGSSSTTGKTLRYAINSTVNDQCLAHEVGHCIGAYHNNNVTWDSSISCFGWYGSSVMCTPLGTKAWYAPQYHKFYDASNRTTAQNVLDHY